MAGFKVQFETGQTVEFDSQPTQADIDEAYHHLTSGALGAAPADDSFLNRAGNWLKESGQDALGSLEATANVASGALSVGTGLIPATMQSVNNLTQGNPANFEQNYVNAMNAMTYQPRTEKGQEIAETAGDFINRNVVPLAPIAGLLHGGLAEAQHGVPKAPKAKPTGPDVTGAMGDLMEPGWEIPPNRVPGNQGQLFPQEQVTEKIGSRNNTVVPGAASQYDPFQEQSSYNVRPNPAQMELPIPNPNELPPVIRQNPAGVGTTGLEDPGLVQAVRNGAPQDVRVFDEMQQQLQNGQQSPVDTTLPRGNAIGDMVNDIRSRSNQEAIDQRQAELEADVRRHQALDFNAQERARQEAAPVPGIENYRAEMERQAAAQRAEQAAKDQAAAGQEAEQLINTSKFSQGPISSRGPIGRQRGAWDPTVIKDAMEKLATGAMSARDYLNAWHGAFDARQWGKVLRGLDNPKSDTTIALMSPREFMRFAEPRTTEELLDAPRLHQKINEGLESNNGLLDAPTLWMRNAGNGIAQVTGHEGRHRMDVFQQNGISKVPVVLSSHDIPWGGELPTKLRPEWVGDKSVLDMPMPKVMHEGVPSPHREVPFRKSSPGGKQSGYILIPGKKQKAIENLNSALKIEAKLGEMAPSHWTPDEAVKRTMEAPDVDQNVLQRALNYFTKGGLYMALKTHNPLLRYGAEKVNEADRLTRADVRDWIYGRFAPAVRKLSEREQGDIWPVIDMADHAQKPIDLESLAKRGFSEDQIKLVQEHRAVMSYGMSMLNKARAAAGKDPIDPRVAYAAMRASGDFRRFVFDKEGGDVVGILGSNFRQRLNKLKADFEKQGYFVGEERYFGGMPRERGSANAAFMSAIDSLADSDPRIQNFVDVLDQIRTKEIYNFLNAKTHTLGKKGIFGMEGRKPWQDAAQNAKDGFEAQIAYMEAAIKWGHMSESLNQVRQVMSQVAEKKPAASAIMERYMYNALGFNPSETGRSIEQAFANAFKSTGVGFSVMRKGLSVARATTNALLLSLNPRFWLTNIVQPMQTMPGMKAMLIARGLDAGFDLGTGWSYLAQGADTAIRKNGGEGLNGFEKAAHDYAIKNHVYGTDLIEHTNRVRKDAIYYANKVSNSVAGSIESATRQVVFYGLAHMLKENGMRVGDGLFEAAHNMTDMAMNNYSMVDRPQAYNSLGPVGDLAVNLQSYKHNELSRLALFAREAKDYKSLRPLTAQLAATVAFAGMLGMTGYSEADEVVKIISKLMGKPTSLTNEVMKLSEGINQKMYNATGGKVDQPYLLSHGMFSMAGLDMSKSIGLNQLVPNTAMDMFFPGGSKLADIGVAGWDMATNPSVMNAKRLAHAAAPIGLQGALDNAWFTQQTDQGRLALRPRDLAGQAYRNNTDYWAKNFGFTGIHEAVQRQKTYEVENISREYDQLRQPVMEKMRDELFSKGNISNESIQQYLKYRGNPNTISQDLQRFTQQQNMSAADLATLKGAVSTSVTAQMKALDYLDAFGAKLNGNK